MLLLSSICNITCESFGTCNLIKQSSLVQGLVPIGRFYPADDSDDANWQDEESYLSNCEYDGANLPSDGQPIDSSDDYNSDIIPFAPHEYERIRGSDVDTQTDFSPEECEQAELTDGSIRELTEINKRAHLNAESEAEMLRQRSQDAVQKKRPKSKDIGYGSESPSNDELERNLVAMDASSDGSEHLERINQKFATIVNSPSQHFYKMTMVDTDFSTDRNDTDDSADRVDRQNRKVRKKPIYRS